MASRRFSRDFFVKELCYLVNRGIVPPMAVRVEFGAGNYNQADPAGSVVRLVTEEKWRWYYPIVPHWWAQRIIAKWARNITGVARA